jgi:hypothetical protein
LELIEAAALTKTNDGIGFKPSKWSEIEKEFVVRTQASYNKAQLQQKTIWSIDQSGMLLNLHQKLRFEPTR